MTDSSSFISRVSELVESEEFFKDLVSEISKVDNSTNRSKLLLELLSYSVPKIKTQDADIGKQKADIQITFVDAEKPKVIETDADKVSED